MSETLQESIEKLIADGERDGCVNLSRFNEFVAEHELDDEDVARPLRPVRRARASR